MTDKQRDETFTIDFVGGAVGHRLRSGEGRGQALAKAAGLKNGKTPKIVDATAGLGRDAFLLASLGAEVTLIERSPGMHALLADAMARADAEGGIYREIVSRMNLLHGDSRALIPTLSPEVVVIDPMHPPRQNTALVKKEMRVLRELVGADLDQAELMEIALAHAAKRVVLKWPLRAEPMPGIRKPSHQLPGKSTRYDVFMILVEKPA
ncbi:class I SAM-dependent methyltransferase [Agrobacterium sp. lyk4-40-TYG-31]|uniref:class I SAM-dependent methyltransferase n=1 Tax=Agrobacterium sp. lyk4-40-TYG-31 TaxID=3040276 RepID=UPI00254C96C1|nr:class I SAM-dependent methyltransferase [Agrobacterium sp. lyk4-40-TYG-31]